MKQVTSISVEELEAMSEGMFEGIVKADLDINKRIVVLDMEMHADGEAYLLENGSKQNDLWGINLHPKKYGTDDFIEYDSMINIRPRQDNPTRYVLDEGMRETIKQLINEVVHA